MVASATTMNGLILDVLWIIPLIKGVTRPMNKYMLSSDAVVGMVSDDVRETLDATSYPPVVVFAVT